MQELLEYIVKNLVSNPDAVQIDEQNDGGNVSLYLSVDPKDMGLIIGKGGQTIHAIRKLLTVRAIAENVRVNLQLNDPQGDQRRKEEGNQESEDNQEEKSQESAEPVAEEETSEEVLDESEDK